MKVGTQQYNNDDNDSNDGRTIYVQEGGGGWVQLPYKKDGALVRNFEKNPKRY